ncbi:MAG: hypothetical protein HAW67_03980 [Endozoicomonadaceae bacterium]|nr:hypothetical protein [Endozoicomonadaceae bacterium]
MEVKNIFTILSEDKKAISYSSLLFETRIEKNCFIASIFFLMVYVILSVIDQRGLALVSALFAIVSHILYSIASFVNLKEFINHPIRGYVRDLHKGIEIEKEFLQNLSVFSNQALVEAKGIAEYEIVRIRNNISFLSGSIDKVGIFPSLLAFFYAYHEYQASPDTDILANLILGSFLGMYAGVLLIQRISNWQNRCVFLLNQAIELKRNNNQS